MQIESRQKLNALLAATGHALSVDDVDDILELDRLAREISDPQTGIDSPLTEHAVYVRGIPVYPLTLAHLEFLDSTSEEFGFGESDQSACILWAVTQPRVTADMYDQRRTRDAIKRWLRECPWTQSDMAAVMDLRYGRLKKAEGAEKVNNDGALLGMLAREYGQSPDYWMYDAPLGVVESCVADWVRCQEAQAAAYRRANGGKGPVAPPIASPKFAAVKRFRECAERIEAKWRSEA